MKQRPFAITVLGWLYIAIGAVALWFDGGHILGGFHREDPWILLVHLLAIVAGAFMLRGANWARWLALLWIAAHVVIGALNGMQQALFHALVFAGITFLLFRTDAREWFGSKPAIGN